MTNGSSVLYSVVELLSDAIKPVQQAGKDYRLATCVIINLKFEALERAGHLSRDTYSTVETLFCICTDHTDMAAL
jgi:hypothetical protein